MRVEVTLRLTAADAAIARTALAEIGVPALITTSGRDRGYRYLTFDTSPDEIAACVGSLRDHEIEFETSDPIATIWMTIGAMKAAARGGEGQS